MSDLDPGKLIVIGIVALVAIPSKDLPRVMRALGQFMGKARRMSAEFQGQFMEAMREMEVADLKKEIEETNKAVLSATSGSFDPLSEARKQITNAVEDAGAPPSPQPPREEPPLMPTRRIAIPNEEMAAEAVASPTSRPERAASVETQPSTAPNDEAGDGAGVGNALDEKGLAQTKAAP